MDIYVQFETQIKRARFNVELCSHTHISGSVGLSGGWSRKTGIFVGSTKNFEDECDFIIPQFNLNSGLTSDYSIKVIPGVMFNMYWVISLLDIRFPMDLPHMSTGLIRGNSNTQNCDNNKIPISFGASCDFIVNAGAEIVIPKIKIGWKKIKIAILMVFNGYQKKQIQIF